ncbi:MAG: hypothetical protein JNN05_11080 [Candidatus Omnitrophica bacterium]|nr:hypothetical protein [Candidatus Omnitrophota bacterium]
MRNLIIAFIFLAIAAHIGFAKENQPDPYSPMDPMATPEWSNETGRYNQTNTTQPTTTKTRSKWDFSDHPEDNKKAADVSKQQKYSPKKQEYRRPKEWQPKKSLTTNNVTTDKLK